MQASFREVRKAIMRMLGYQDINHDCPDWNGMLRLGNLGVRRARDGCDAVVVGVIQERQRVAIGRDETQVIVQQGSNAVALEAVLGAEEPRLDVRNNINGGEHELVFRLAIFTVELELDFADVRDG